MNKLKAFLPASRFLAFYILMLLALTWGSSYILIQQSLLAFRPDQVAALRMGTAFLTVLPFIAGQLRTIKKEDWYGIAVVATCGNLIPGFLFPIAQQFIASSLAGVLNSLTPISVLLLGALWFRRKVKTKQLIGVMIGLSGAILLGVFAKSNVPGSNNWFALLVFLATVLYAYSANAIQTYLQKVKALTVLVGAFLLIGPPSLLYLFTTDFVDVVQTHPDALRSCISVTILGVVGTVIASLLFIYLVQITNAIIGSLVSYLIPLVAIGWGWWFGEAITVFYFLGLGLILSGVYLAGKER